MQNNSRNAKDGMKKTVKNLTMRFTV